MCGVCMHMRMRAPMCVGHVYTCVHICVEAWGSSSIVLCLINPDLTDTANVGRWLALGIPFPCLLRALGYSWPAIPTGVYLGSGDPNSGLVLQQELSLRGPLPATLLVIEKPLLQLHAVVATDEKITWGICFKINRKWV